MRAGRALRNVVSLLAVCALSAYGADSPARAAQGGKTVPPNVLEGEVNAPEFPQGLDWLNTSTPLRIRDLRGKFVLLDFWTFCCINCMHILPDLRRLETRYDQELVVIGVHSAKFANEKDTAQIRSAILRYEIRHPVVNDSNFDVWQSYAANAWPTVVLINPVGKIIAQGSGEGIFEPLDGILREAVPFFEAKGLLKRSPLALSLEEARKASTLLDFPGKVSSDEKTGRLYITDSNHHRIVVTDASGRILDVIGSGVEGHEDGTFEKAQFHHPQGTSASGDILYIADTDNHLVRVADLRARTVETVLGTGVQAQGFNQPGRGASVALNSPWDVLPHDGKLYVAMAGFHQLWVADIKTWYAGPFAGSGRENIVDHSLLEAALAQPSGIATDGRKLYFADSETSSIRAADLDANGAVRTIIGKGLFEFGDIDGDGSKARLQHPLGVAYRDGLVYVADTYNSRIKVVDPVKRTSRAYAGNGNKTLADGKLAAASFNEPGGLAWLGGKLYIADTNNHQIRVLDPRASTVSTLELTGLEKLAQGRMESFRGRLLDLGRRQLKAGSGRLALNVILPAGHKFNKDAPFFMRWQAGNGSGLKFGLDAASVDFKKASFPLSVPVEFSGGRSDLTIDTVVYYCTDQSSVCYVDPIRVKVAVVASPGGAAVLPLDIPVKKPGL
jgi:DNA-binding beta-propeller fold protein YncE